MFILGITGGIGSGKTSLASLCQEAGLIVIDADQLSHEVTGPHGSALKEIAEHFGPDYIIPDQGLDRPRIAQLVFKDKKALDKLSQIVHTQVLNLVKRQVIEAEQAGIQAVVLDFPIPVEDGFLNLCNYVVAIWADPEVRLTRLAARGLSRQEAQLRMKVQMTRSEYADKADQEISNNSDLNDLRQAAQKLLADQLGDRGIPFTALV